MMIGPLNSGVRVVIPIDRSTCVQLQKTISAPHVEKMNTSTARISNRISKTGTREGWHEKVITTETGEGIREPAVRPVYEQELTTPHVARGLSKSGQTTDLDAEVIRLKRELAAARMECSI